MPLLFIYLLQESEHDLIDMDYTLTGSNCLLAVWFSNVTIANVLIIISEKVNHLLFFRVWTGHD